MTHPSKLKGNTFERELVNQALDSGIDAKRAYASNGEALGLHATVDCLIGSKRVQAKRRARIAAWLKPSEHVDAVAVREDRGETLVVISWWEYLDLVKAASASEERKEECAT